MFFGNAYWTAVRANILEEATRITESYERILVANMPAATLRMVELVKDATNAQTGKLIAARNALAQANNEQTRRLLEVALTNAELNTQITLVVYRFEMERMEAHRIGHDMKAPQTGHAMETEGEYSDI